MTELEGLLYSANPSNSMDGGIKQMERKNIQSWNRKEIYQQVVRIDYV